MASGLKTDVIQWESQRDEDQPSVIDYVITLIEGCLYCHL